MITREHLVQRSPVLWEIPMSFRSDMRVPALLFTSEAMLGEVLDDRSLEQLVNVATLPGIRKAAMVMPDVHEGYGFPIGGVAALSYPEGVISPGGIGYDINCGVRLLKSTLMYIDVKPYLETLAKRLFCTVPSGVGRGGKLKLGKDKIDVVLYEGAKRMVKDGYGVLDDLKYIESHGVLEKADPNVVSNEAKQRGHDQLGTIGAGNHFLEVDKIDEIFDEQIAEAFGLSHNQIVVLIHTGSRGLGHQVATDHMRIMNNVMSSYGIKVPDRELACVPLNSSEGMAYFSAMAAAANFAFANRQMITWEVRQVWSHLFPSSPSLEILYDVAHNIAKIEEHKVDDHIERLIVHRKGATRAFPPGNAELPDVYRSTGQPVLIPGSMGSASYVLAGTQGGRDVSFSSTCHGAGRRMSRHAAKKIVKGKKLLEQMTEAGIYVETGSVSGLPEEAQFAYKDIHDVVEVVDRAGIAKKIARLHPVIVVKG